MTGWFSPGLLLRLLWRVVLSDLFGQYADRRLIVAALDTAPPDELVGRAQQFLPGKNNEELWTLEPDEDGAVWVDFVADLGDGFDATYAIASLLGQERLAVNGDMLKRGQILFMGGDEVYPRAAPETYQKQLRDPYDWAFPDPNPGLLKGPPVYAVPGNHDWYDGLVLFLALFCRKDHMHLGGWRTHQRRSYFAVQLTERWWVWAIDAQLADDIDQPQKEYFLEIAKAMPDNAKIILCGPEPGWLYTGKAGNKALSVMSYVGWIALRQKRGITLPLVLSGDTHHYSRYVADDGNTQFVTSGGGGAFLHPTHQVAPSVDLDRAVDGYSWLTGHIKKLTLGSDQGKEAVYPSKAESLSMLRGNFAFVWYNPAFAAVLGAAYWILSLASAVIPEDIYYLAPLLLFAGFWGYTKNQEGGGLKTFLVSAVNGLLHSVGAAVTIGAVAWFNARYIDLAAWPRASFLLHAVETILVGGIIAGSLFGAYLYLTSRWLNMNHNDAFSSMRRNSHRHFLRLRIKGDTVTIFPVALKTIPKRKDWRVNADKIGQPPPAYVPASPLRPELIEKPFSVS
ncbi:metallophosphoesterase [Mesorhizobium abyssinicae]|uniref:Metallophosphoesterase n=1 Tax=Mesorhizobium abyssinicae TaxID=1209958 RepID=A0ABU5AUC1_9HYPH|nr:metallophosphoesterase [Mesorhizobium abyssinicae]MDX8540784.1 metallophosphoesterase [Mesorhizobium abyssinicae]